jgi:hypothetical protein
VYPVKNRSCWLRTISSPRPPLGGIRCTARLAVFRLYIPIGVGIGIGIGIDSIGSILTAFIATGFDVRDEAMGSGAVARAIWGGSAWLCAHGQPLPSVSQYPGTQFAPCHSLAAGQLKYQAVWFSPGERCGPAAICGGFETPIIKY